MVLFEAIEASGSQGLATVPHAMQRSDARGALPPLGPADAPPGAGASFNSLPPELQAHIASLVLYDDDRAALRAACPAACAAVSGGVRALYIDCVDAPVGAPRRAAARCGQWAGLRYLELRCHEEAFAEQACSTARAAELCGRVRAAGAPSKPAASLQEQP